MKIVLLGHNKWACMVLERLIQDGHKVLVVITETEEFEMRLRKEYLLFSGFGAYDDLAKKAQYYGIEVLKPADINASDVLQYLESLSPELVIVVSYHQILKSGFLERFPTINIHGGLLPKYRGRAPINWAIINGEISVGVTVHWVVRKVDAGPIIVQKTIPIEDNDTAIKVLLKTLPYYPLLISEAVKMIAEGKAEGLPQQESEATYFPTRRPVDGTINWWCTAHEIHNLIRALSYPYPGARAILRKGNKPIILDNSILESEKVTGIPGIVFRSLDDAIWISTVSGSLRVSAVRLGRFEEPLSASSVIRPGETFLLYPGEVSMPDEV